MDITDMAQPPPSQPPTAHAPDPEEDDLDDLDDVLDEFQPTTKPAPPAATSSQPSPPAPKASGPGRPPAVEDASEFPDAGEEALAAQLQAGMANLMSELDENPDMQAQFEAMMKELIAAGEAPSEAEAARHVEQAAKAVPKIEGDDDEPKGRGVGRRGRNISARRSRELWRACKPLTPRPLPLRPRLKRNPQRRTFSRR